MSANCLLGRPELWSRFWLRQPFKRPPHLVLVGCRAVPVAGQPADGVEFLEVDSATFEQNIVRDVNLDDLGDNQMPVIGWTADRDDLPADTFQMVRRFGGRPASA